MHISAYKYTFKRICILRNKNTHIVYYHKDNIKTREIGHCKVNVKLSKDYNIFYTYITT